MMHKLCLLTSAFFFVALSLSQAQSEVTYSKQIASILYQNCTGCHRPESIGPFSLTSYDDAYQNRFLIAEATEHGEMPPWPPDPIYRRYAHERLLSDTQIEAIQTWVQNGAPEGNPAETPPVPIFQDGAILGTPDLKITIPEYTVQESEDDYRCFVIPSGFNVDKFIKKIEMIPGNISAVHHILIFSDTSQRCQQLDDADPLPGYASFGGVGSNSAQLIGGWVPGMRPTIYPEGIGVLVSKNANFIMQVHYAPGSKGKKDKSSVHLFLTEAPDTRNVFMVPILNHSTTLVNGPLFIPANTIKSFLAKYQTPLDVSILGITPHMHLLGKSIKVYALLPGSQDTIPLIRINQWDFHWQMTYFMQKLQKLPRGATVYAEAVYDNTTNNPENPSNPPINVQLGEGTKDEMMLVYFSFLVYQPGDENIILDSTLITDRNIPVCPDFGNISIYPNPGSNQLTLNFFSKNAENLSCSLYNLLGKKTTIFFENKHLNIGTHTLTFETEFIPAGVYYLELDNGIHKQNIRWTKQ